MSLIDKNKEIAEIKKIVKEKMRTVGEEACLKLLALLTMEDLTVLPAMMIACRDSNLADAVGELAFVGLTILMQEIELEKHSN